MADPATPRVSDETLAQWIGAAENIAALRMAGGPESHDLVHEALEDADYWGPALFDLRDARAAVESQRQQLAALREALQKHLRDEQALSADLRRARTALKHLSETADTLSPQEFINQAVWGGAVEMREYQGECHPHTSIVEYRGMLRRLRLAAAPILASFRTMPAEITDEQVEAFSNALAATDRSAGGKPDAV